MTVPGMSHTPADASHVPDLVGMSISNTPADASHVPALPGMPLLLEVDACLPAPIDRDSLPKITSLLLLDDSPTLRTM
eukprot:CAMPEP_0174934744 /NCGR_PEP_ID=MMETSP1355-20121228/50797_1 /TAXON_ID=464990 /ORGANISM="Hemiselmis tepida, Strain CCMP443" /LENGTH=77 /DNA_ID=CAMNT_0016181377 /DNA_START=38 /DNA_END=271 /DNA_ORIENTATION=-